MSKAVIYASNIKPAKSIIGLLNGSEMFCIDNPYFRIPGSRCDASKFMKVKQPKSAYGIMFNPVQLMVKPQNSSVYTSRFPHPLQEYG